MLDFSPVDSIVGEVEVGILNLLAMSELLTKVVSRTREIWFKQTNTHDIYYMKNIRYLVFFFQ